MRKNGMVGAIPGSGRPKKEYVKKNFNISFEANEIISALPFGQAGSFVSDAIVEHQTKVNKKASK